MWGNFKSMPVFLKLLTFHALVCLSIFLVSVIPRDHFVLDNHNVSYGEWWSSGAGPLCAVLGLAMAVSGLLFLSKVGFGRVVYLAIFGGCLTIPFMLSHDFLPATMGASIAAAIGYYLFKSRGVRAYFASNNSFKADGSAAA